MTSEIEALPCKMMLVERSYRTRPGWRLATFQEANDNLEMIKQRGLLKERQRARLLDGWISGPRYKFQIGDDFRRFLGYMLLIQTQPSPNYSLGNSGPARSIYAGVTLTPKGREVALLLCAYDWNYEVVYWLLNSWENRDPLNPQDVKEGNIPFSNKAKFVEMNIMICHLGRILGEEGLAGQKAGTTELSGDSVKDVMVSMGKSCWDKFSPEHKKILGKTFLETIEEFTSNIIWQCSGANWFQGFASPSADIWNFFWYYISFNALAGIVQRSFLLLIKELDSEEYQARNQKDFIMSAAILHYVLKYEIYEGGRILEQAYKDAIGDDRQRLNDTLKNRSSAYYDKTGNYHVLNKILIYALKSDDSLLAEKVLEWGAQPQATLGPDRQDMALHYAIKWCRSNKVLRSLLDKCHSKEVIAYAANEEGMTALHLTCFHADLSMCQMVLESGGRPDARDNEGCLPLHRLIDSAEDSTNIKEFLRSLFDKCCSKEQYANATDDEGMTALHWACRNADVSVYEIVLEYGGRPDVPDNRGCLPLHYAVDGTDGDRKEIVRSIFNKCHSKEQLVNAIDKEGMTVLHRACHHADASVCEMVLEYGGRPDVPDKRGRLPLHYAVERSNEDIVDVLTGEGNSDTVDSEHEYERRAEMVTWKDKDGVSPLDMAVKNYMIRIMVKLLSVSQQSLDSYFHGLDSAKLLREFASEGNLKVVNILLERGAETLACDGMGRTALHHASMCGDDDKAWELTNLMLAKCTSEEKKKWIEKQDNHGQTVLYVAAMKGHERLFDYFCSINGDNLQIKDAERLGLICDVVKRSSHDNPAIIWSLRGVGRRSESIIDHSGLTLVHVAASVGKKYIVDSLLKGSSNPKEYVRTPDVLGQTALHKAAKGGHADVVTVLLHWGAHPLLERDTDGRTALHFAVQSESEGQAKAVINLLLSKCGSNEKKLLLLWASATGLGTADQHLPDESPLKKTLKDFLVKEKNDIPEKVGKENKLLRTAACLGDIEMTKNCLLGVLK